MYFLKKHWTIFFATLYLCMIDCQNSGSIRIWNRHQVMKQNKEIIFCITTALVAALVISGCSREGSRADSTDHEKNKYYSISVPEGQSLLRDYTNVSEVPGIPGARIAIVAKEMDLDYWEAVREGAEQAVNEMNEKYGYEGEDAVVLTMEGSDNGSDVEAQINQIDTVLAENPTALCISAVDVESCKPQLEAAVDNKIPVIALESGVESPLLAATCETDNEEAAREAVQKLCAAIDDSGEIALVTHTAAAKTAKDRMHGFLWELSLHPDVKVAANLVQNDTDSIETMVSTAIELHPDLKGVFCTNEQTAAETLKTLKKLDRTDLTVVGFDAGEVQREAIADGSEYGLICQNPRGMGYVSVIAAMFAASGEQVDRHIDTGYCWIDQNNLNAEESKVFLY